MSKLDKTNENEVSVHPVCITSTLYKCLLEKIRGKIFCNDPWQIQVEYADIQMTSKFKRVSSTNCKFDNKFGLVFENSDAISKLPKGFLSVPMSSNTVQSNYISVVIKLFSTFYIYIFLWKSYTNYFINISWLIIHFKYNFSFKDYSFKKSIWSICVKYDQQIVAWIILQW